MSFNYGKSSFYLDLKLKENPKSKSVFIKDIERIIRTSVEYRNFIKFLKTEALLNYCNILNKLPEDIINKVSIEMHHYPFTLYDLVEIVLDKHMENNLDFSRLSLANEVMEQHFLLKVGIVPLTKTMHELAHSRNILISTKDIFGNYSNFIQEYSLNIDKEKLEYIKELEKKEDIEIYNYNKATLEVNPILFIDDSSEENFNEFD